MKQLYWTPTLLCAALLATALLPASTLNAEDLNQFTQRVGTLSDAQVIDELEPMLEQLKTFEYHKYNDDFLRKLEIITYRTTEAPLRRMIEAKIIETLPQANTAGKQILCRHLHMVGAAASIPVLVELLSDPEVAHTARYALARYDDPAVDEALIGAGEKLAGDLKIGVLNSLGNRRSANAIPLMAESLKSKDPAVRRAAAYALGRIGGEKAVEVLEGASADDEPTRIELANALLGCAESLSADNPDAVVAIYEKLAADPVTTQVKFAAFRGLFLNQKGASAELLNVALDDADDAFRAFAIQLVNEVDSEEAVNALIDLLKTTDDVMKVVILRAMGDRGESRFETAVRDCLATSTNADVSKTALYAMGEVGTTQSISALLDVASGDTEELKSVAAASLRNLKGEVIDPALIQTASNSDDDNRLRVAAIEALARRKTHGATSTMMKLADSDDTALRLAAANALAVIGTTDEFPALCRMAVARTDSAERSAILDACRRVLQRTEDPEGMGQLALQELAKTPVSSQAVLIELLALSGSDEACAFVQSAVKQGAPDLRRVGLATMKAWPNAAPIDDLVAVFKAPRSSEERSLALEGCIAIAQYVDDAPALFKQILERVSTDADRKQILGGMGKVGETAEMIRIAEEFFDNPALRPTAGLTMVHVSNRLRRSDEDAAMATLEKVIQEVGHADVRQRALNVIKEIEKQEGWIATWKLNGPYEHDDAKSGDQIHAMQFGPEVDGETVEWIDLPSGAVDGESKVDLERAFSATPDHCTAYLVSYVWAEEAGDYLFQMHVDDLFSLNINGEEAIEKRGSSNEGVKVALKEGWNRLMLKVSDHEGGWTFRCRFRNLEGRKPVGMKYQAEQPE